MFKPLLTSTDTKIFTNKKSSDNLFRDNKLSYYQNWARVSEGIASYAILVWNPATPPLFLRARVVGWEMYLQRLQKLRLLKTSRRKSLLNGNVVFCKKVKFVRALENFSNIWTSFRKLW